MVHHPAETALVGLLAFCCLRVLADAAAEPLRVAIRVRATTWSREGELAVQAPPRSLHAEHADLSTEISDSQNGRGPCAAGACLNHSGGAQQVPSLPAAVRRRAAANSASFSASFSNSSGTLLGTGCVLVSFRVHNIDLDQLLANVSLRSGFAAAISQALVEEAGTAWPSEGLRLVLSHGSLSVGVAVDAELNTNTTQERVWNSTSLEASLLWAVHQVDGIDAVAQGAISMNVVRLRHWPAANNTSPGLCEDVSASCGSYFCHNGSRVPNSTCRNLTCTEEDCCEIETATGVVTPAPQSLETTASPVSSLVPDGLGLASRVGLCELRLGELGSGVSCSGADNGTGYILYSEMRLDSRFLYKPPAPGGAKHLLCVRFQRGQWQHRSRDGWDLFQSVATDLLIARVDFGSNYSLSKLRLTGPQHQGSFENVPRGYTGSDIEFRQAGGGHFEVSGRYILTEGCRGFRSQGSLAAADSCEFVAGISCNLQRPIVVLLAVILGSCILCFLYRFCQVRLSRQRQDGAECEGPTGHPCKTQHRGGESILDDATSDCEQISNISAVPVDCKEVTLSVVYKEPTRRKEVLEACRPAQLEDTVRRSPAYSLGAFLSQFQHQDASEGTAETCRFEDAFSAAKKQDSQEVSEYSTSMGSGTLESKPPSPSSGQGTASTTGFDDLSNQAEGSVLQYLPQLKEVARVLSVLTPNGQYICAGEYHLVPTVMPNGMPVWQQKDGEHYLYSAKAQTWCIGGPDVVTRNFDTSAGWIYQGCHHGGLLPHEVLGHWLRWNGQSFEVDSNIQVTSEFASLGENREHEKDSFKSGSGSFSKSEPDDLLEMVLELTHVGGERTLVLGLKQPCIVLRLQAGMPSCVGPSRQRSLFKKLVPRLPAQVEDLFELHWWPPCLFLHKPTAESMVAVNGEILEGDHMLLHHGSEVTACAADRGPPYNFRVVSEPTAVQSLLGALKAAPAQGMSVLDLRGSRLSREERRALGNFKDETLRIVI